MPETGLSTTRLIVLRGNSASGKSAAAQEIRDRYGRGIAIVGQDTIRRIILRDRDQPGAPNIGLIDLTTRYALDQGYHVVVEGILYADHYGEMLPSSIVIIGAGRGAITTMSPSRKPCAATPPNRKRQNMAKPRCVPGIGLAISCLTLRSAASRKQLLLEMRLI